MKVYGVTEMSDFDISRKSLFNRCIHMSDAKMIKDGDIRRAPELANGDHNCRCLYNTSLGYVSEEEKFNFVSDWYLNGDWQKYNKTFMYGMKGDHLMGNS